MRIKSGLVVGFDSPPWHNSNNVNFKDMDMNKISLWVLGVVVFVIAFCYAGKSDYNEAVMCSMSNGTYEVLREKLGDVSDSVLVEAYMADKAYWDSLGRMK